MGRRSNSYVLPFPLSLMPGNVRPREPGKKIENKSKFDFSDRHRVNSLSRSCQDVFRGHDFQCWKPEIMVFSSLSFHCSIVLCSAFRIGLVTYFSLSPQSLT